MIKPFGFNIYIEPIKEDSPLKQAENSSITEKGKIIAVGEDVHKFKPGDIILFNAFLANKVEIDGNSYYFVKYSGDEIFATVYADN